MRRVMAAVAAVVAPAKVYLLLLAEQQGFEHTHFHVIPRRHDVPEEFRGIGILHYDGKPAWAEAETIAGQVRRVLG